MTTTLYQFPISHYCEKARWALDYKGVQYQVKNLLPGLHMKPLQRLCNDTTVPVLSMNGKHIQNSDRIIDFLDEQITAKPLTPPDASIREQAYYWEKLAAEQIGDPLRLYFYHFLLEHPRAVIDRFTHNGPWYGRLFYAIAYPKVSQRIRHGYKITAQTATQAKQTVENTILKLEQHLQHRAFLAGDTFSRADLSVCALLSPFVQPSPRQTGRTPFLPDAITEFQQHYRDSLVFDWVTRIYKTYRH